MFDIEESNHEEHNPYNEPHELLVEHRDTDSPHLWEIIMDEAPYESILE
jgi:hypothetical protein